MIIDEIESHLHPRWQRRILPALKAALPKTQIIVATHSPFVISSTEDAIVHILDWDKKNHNAFLRERIRAPFGQSLQATLMDVFGVDSEFDQETEQDLDRWDTLRRKSRTAQEEKEFKRLAKMLAARSEELRFIVGSSLEPIAQLAVPKKQRRKAS